MAKSDNAAFAGLSGEYTFRFNGFNNDSASRYYIAGLGQFRLEPNGDVTDGAQHFSRVSLDGVDADKLVVGVYSLSGKYILDTGSGFGRADIKFVDPTTNTAVYNGAYTLRRAGADRFWLISESLTNPDDDHDFYFETTSIEAVRVGD